MQCGQASLTGSFMALLPVHGWTMRQNFDPCPSSPIPEVVAPAGAAGCILAAEPCPQRASCCPPPRGLASYQPVIQQGNDQQGQDRGDQDAEDQDRKSVG